MDTTPAIDAARLNARGAADVQVKLPVKDLEPGEYFSRIEAVAASDRATRTARFVVVGGG